MLGRRDTPKTKHTFWGFFIWLLPLGSLMMVGIGVASLLGYSPPKEIASVSILMLIYGCSVMVLSVEMVSKWATVSFLIFITAVFLLRHLDVPYLTKGSKIILKFLFRD